MENLFSEFEPISKEAWQEQVLKELKGRPLSDLQWQLEEGIMLDPFYMDEDVEEFSSPFPKKGWLIGETVEVKEEKLARESLMRGLSGGVNSPAFVFHKKEILPEKLLHEVQLEAISPYFIADNFDISNWEAWAKVLHNWAQEQGTQAGELHGGFCVANWKKTGGKEIAHLFHTLSAFFPKFSVFAVNGEKYRKSGGEITAELSQILREGIDLLDRLTDEGVPAEQAADKMCFQVSIGTSYLAEMVKLRALALLWANVCRAYGIKEVKMPFLDVYFDGKSYSDDAYHNMIKATTMAMSALLGGASRLTVIQVKAPAQEADPFALRIARNIQHLLQMESHFDKIPDAVAGSYYIEKMIDAVVERVWPELSR